MAYLDETGLAYLWGKIKDYIDAHSGGGGGGSVSGVKGDAESSYRTGNVNLTPANIGAAASAHEHATSDITSGTLPVERGGTGATGVTVDATATDFVTLASGFSTSGEYNRFARYGKVVMFELTLRRTSALAANSQTKVGTLKEGYRPAMAAYGNFMTNNAVGSVTLSTDGSIYVRSSVQVAANGAIRFGATFILA